MAQRLEITLNPDLPDAEGLGIKRKAFDYFSIEIDSIRTISIVTIDKEIDQLCADDAGDEQGLDKVGLIRVRTEIFTNPVTQISSYSPLDIDCDWIIWVGLRPGVRDNPGSTAVEAIEDLLSIKFARDEDVYTSKRYCITGANITREQMEKIAAELLSNDIIEQSQVYSREEWDPEVGIGIIIPKVMLDHTPTITNVSIDSDETLMNISFERNLALNPNDVPTIRNYFLKEEIKAERAQYGLSDPTDLELEYISQGRSDHCNHNTFQGLFKYTDLATGETEEIDNLFNTCIKEPTLKLQKEKDWVISVLWDNAGAGRFDDDHFYVITGETHNSPSNMEAYGGSITGIVGVYRDPMGTGKGAKLVMGGYGFCVGHRNYDDDLTPKLHPRRLLDGVIEGVRDGGNKSGIPTTFGQVSFDTGYMGKCLVFVTAIGIMPSTVDGAPSDQKKASPGDLLIMCGGRIGKDGIHGVTASSEVFSEHTPAGHVQIGDPYTQKKIQDFLIQVRDEGLITFITDNGGGGLSSSIGESARSSGGCKVFLEKAPLKYDGLDQWEIWISESQERMTLAIKPENLDRFMELSKKHAVESTVLGEYTDSGMLHITYDGKPCAYVDLDFLESGFPQWEFDAQWQPPHLRGLYEPSTKEPTDYNKLLTDMLGRPNICSKEWVTRQYDHEVQGTSVIKPLVGEDRDVNSDAAVIRPVLSSNRGLAFSQSLLPWYSAIDAGNMTECTIDEALRRVIAVGADPDHVGGVDNFCWPNIEFDETTNPDGKHKAAQLVRSCKALRDMCLACGIPLLSGKDSMYVDGYLPGKYGEMQKVSALETMQFSALARVEDIEKCISMDFKSHGDFIYLIGNTKDELGASEYYQMLGHIGLNVPTVTPDAFMKSYRKLYAAICKGLAASVHGVYRGGLGVHLALAAAAGNLGMNVYLEKIPFESSEKITRNDTALFSESSGRFIVTVQPEDVEEFEKTLSDIPCTCIGQVIDDDTMLIKGIDGTEVINTPVSGLKKAWKKPFEDLI